MQFDLEILFKEINGFLDERYNDHERFCFAFILTHDK